MRSVVNVFWVAVATVFGGLSGAVPVFVMGLSVPMFLVGPLALFTGVLLASLAGGWTANLTGYGTPHERTRSKLGKIFSALSVTAVISIGLGFTAAFGVNYWNFSANLATAGAVYLPGIVLFTVVALVSIKTFRAPVEEGLGSGGIFALAVSTLWFVMLFFTVGFGTFLFPTPNVFTESRTMLVIFLLASSLVIAGGAWLYRKSLRSGSDRRSLNTDAAVSLALIGAAPLIVAGTVGLGCTVVACLP